MSTVHSAEKTLVIFLRLKPYEQNACVFCLFDDGYLMSSNRSRSTRYEHSIEFLFNWNFLIGSSYRRNRYSGGSCDGEECMYIGIGVGCGVLVLLVIVSIVVCCCKGVCKVPNRCKSAKNSSKIDTSQNNEIFMDKY